jgi:hypothetical protein
MLSLSYFVMFGSMRVRMPMKNASRRDTRPWKKEEVYSPPLEKWITLILEKKFFIYLGRLCLRSLFHKVKKKGLSSR